VREVAGLRVLDDTYNANPGSVAAALAVLADFDGPRWLALGDMGELGADGEALHREVGVLARRAGVERLYAVGSLARLAADAFGAGGLYFADQTGLLAALRAELAPPVTLLVKGSRSAGMERVVQALLGEV
jgi:UDP-N-acetylmuramoyl-tripeptide--D-alanyl-D-alanine ligase